MNTDLSLDLLVANMIQADERKNTREIAPASYESLGIGIKNSDNLRYVIDKATNWLAVESPEHPSRHGMMESLSLCYKHLFVVSGDLSHLTTSIEITDEIIATTFDDNIQQARHFITLAELKQKRFEQTKEPADLDSVIDAIDMAVVLTPHDDHDKQAERLFLLAALLRDRFFLARERGYLDRGMEYLDRAVEVANLAVKLTAREDKSKYTLQNERLASLLKTRFDETATIQDLNQIIEIREMALLGTPDNDRQLSWLGELLNLLVERFERKKDPADLDRVIAFTRKILKKGDQDVSVFYSEILGGLANYLRIRYELKPTMEDLNEAVQSLELALEIAPTSKLRDLWYGNLALWMSSKFQKTSKSMEDLNRAIAYMEISVAGTNLLESARLRNLANLGGLLSLRFTHTGQREDLDRAIKVTGMAVSDLSPDDPERAELLISFAFALDVQYEHTGQQEDLNRRIESYEKIVTVLPPDSTVYAGCLSSLASALSERFEATESIDDLTRALKLAKTGANMVSANSPHFFLCSWNLGKIIGLQYKRTNNPEDQDSSINMLEAALVATPEGHFFRASIMGSLASSLVGRFISRGNIADLNRAVEILELALKSTLVSFNGRHRFLHHLSICHEMLFQRTRKIHHLNQTVVVMKEAVNALPLSNPNQARVFLKAGYSHEYRHSELDNSEDLEEACRLYKAGLDSENSIPMHRILCARGAANLCARQEDWEQATLLYEAGLNLLSVVSPRTLKHSDKQYTLGQFAGLAAHGASAALNANRQPSDALMILELGRGVIAGLVLELRTDITELRENYPELAGQFIALRDELDSPNGETIPFEDIDSVPLGKLETRRSQETDQKFNEVIARIRELPNFERFLLPPTADETKAAASNGPIVVINVSSYRCDAFLITHSDIRVLNLPNLRESEVNEHATMLNSVGVTSSLLEWLWDVIARPVLEALDFQQSPLGDDWPHLWWIPTGALTQFPIHAAGYHFRGSLETVLDRVSSSYSSSVKALIYGRRNDIRRQVASDESSVKDRATSTDHTRHKGGEISLLVGMSKTPGLHPNSNLHYAAEEVEMLDIICASMGLETIQPDRSREQVLKHMTTCSIFHFAGHGKTDPSDPSRSCILLDDWKDNPLTVGDLRDSNMQNHPPFLGYLSACSTGANKAERLLDEGIHLISAFQLAGFRHVIGTLWEVSDRHCVDVARVLYETIRDEGMTDKAICRGLHRAVRALRDGYVEEGKPMDMVNHLVGNKNDAGPQEVENKNSKREGRDAKLIVTGDQRILQENPQYWAPYVHFGV